MGIIWTYPFPESNATEATAKAELLAAFFQSVCEWGRFASNGIVIVGLKSCSATERHRTEDADFQFKHWGVESVAVAQGFRVIATVGPSKPFWRPTSVSGRSMCKTKEYLAGAVQVKFYIFRISSTA